MNCHSIGFVIAVLLLQPLTKSTICTLRISKSVAIAPSPWESNTLNSLNLSALSGRNLLQKADTQRTVPGIEQELNHPSQTLCLGFSSTTEFWGTPEYWSFRLQLTANYCYEMSGTDDLTRDLLSTQAEIQVSLGPPKSQGNSFRLQEAEPPVEVSIIKRIRVPSDLCWAVSGEALQISLGSCFRTCLCIWILLFPEAALATLCDLAGRARHFHSQN